LFVLVYRISKSSAKKNPNNVFLIHLAITDALMSIYLLNIAITDLMFRGRYVFHARSYNNGVQCKLMSMLSGMSIGMSRSLIPLMSLFIMFGIASRNRMAAVTLPLKHLICLTFWIIHSIVCSVSFTGLVGITSNSCLLFSLGRSMVSGWQYNVFFILYNFLSVLINIMTTARSVYLIYQSSQRVKEIGHVFGKSGRGSSYKTLILLGVCNLMIWIPLQVLPILSLCGVSISTEVANWCVIFVLPLSSISSPFLYTIRNIITK